MWQARCQAPYFTVNMIKLLIILEDINFMKYREIYKEVRKFFERLSPEQQKEKLLGQFNLRSGYLQFLIRLLGKQKAEWLVNDSAGREEILALMKRIDLKDTVQFLKQFVPEAKNIGILLLLQRSLSNMQSEKSSENMPTARGDIVSEKISSHEHQQFLAIFKQTKAIVKSTMKGLSRITDKIKHDLSIDTIDQEHPNPEVDPDEPSTIPSKPVKNINKRDPKQNTNPVKYRSPRVKKPVGKQTLRPWATDSPNRDKDQETLAKGMRRKLKEILREEVNKFIKNEQ